MPIPTNGRRNVPYIPLRERWKIRCIDDRRTICTIYGIRRKEIGFESIGAFNTMSNAPSSTRQLDPLVRRCCRNCKHVRNTTTQYEGYGLVSGSHCAEYQRIVNRFPTWASAFHHELIVAPNDINNCYYFLQKEIGAMPLFDKATSA